MPLLRRPRPRKLIPWIAPTPESVAAKLRCDDPDNISEVRCPMCLGRGAWDWNSKVPCPTCGGLRKVSRLQYERFGKTLADPAKVRTLSARVAFLVKARIPARL
jgi:hypothetical protein